MNPFSPNENQRRRSILEASVKVFSRFGFRKTSMEEIAREADISRQGVYLHFPSKEDLFKASLGYSMEESLAAVREVLEDRSIPLLERIASALDSLDGRCLEEVGANYYELFDAARKVVGEELLAGYEYRTFALLVSCLRREGLQEACEAHALSLPQLAEAILMISRGLRGSCKTREEFRVRSSASLKVALVWCH